MTSGPYLSDFANGYYVRGEAKGKAEGRADSLLSILETRGVALSEAQKNQILQCTDLEQLDFWVRRAVTTASDAEVILCATASGGRPRQSV